jgi:hypothetical protein
MRASTLKVIVNDVSYHVDDPKLSDGLKASVSAIVEDATEGGPLSRILHRDRLNLDRARDREKFAEAAGTRPDDLLEVRDRILDFLAPSTTADEPAEEVDPAVRADALALLDAPDVLDRLGADIRGFGYAGDLMQPLLVFLVILSRLLARPMNLVVGGPSSAGKSFLVSLVARFFPVSATYPLNGMSERVLVYTDADLRHRTLIVGEASALQRDGIGASLLRSLAWEGDVVYETVDSTSEGLKPRRIEKPGPTGFVTTTTKGVEAELETRVLTITVPDDKATTQTILLATANQANGRLPAEPDLRPWHEVQRWLTDEGDRDVTIPFAVDLAQHYPAEQVRSRRDFKQLVTLIQASAILHQRQRQRDEAGRIIASEADYRAIHALAAPVFTAVAAEGVTPAVRETVAKVAELTTLVPEGGRTIGGETVSVRELAVALNLDPSAVSRRVRKALDGGFLVNDEPKDGKPSKLRVGDPLPEKRAALPLPEKLFLPPADNTATVQHPDETARNGAENDRCTPGDRDMHQCNGDAPGVDGVAVGLHAPVQQSFPHHHAENEFARGDRCTVAQGVRGSATRDDGKAAPCVCIDCHRPLPAGWIGHYCAEHGGKPPTPPATDDDWTGGEEGIL